MRSAVKTLLRVLLSKQERRLVRLQRGSRVILHELSAKYQTSDSSEQEHQTEEQLADEVKFVRDLTQRRDKLPDRTRKLLDNAISTILPAAGTKLKKTLR